ncbi:MAG: response regulator transcription factor [Anaerolineae bacterium]|nr:response regulator transcription factor [Anaerolineae bacterium]
MEQVQAQADKPLSAGFEPCVVLVVDDNDFNRDGVALYLRSLGMTTLEAGDEATAYAIAVTERPGAAVVDIVIPTTPGERAYIDRSVGVHLVRRLKALDPAMGIVLFSAYEDRGAEIWELIREGARGIAYMLKGSRPERLRQALEDTRAGHVILDGDAAAGKPQLIRELRARLTPAERPWVERAVRLMPTLSAREDDVARRLAASHNNQGLVEEMGISAKTVEHHISAIYDKLGLAEVDTAAPTLRKATLLAKAYVLYDLTRVE